VTVRRILLVQRVRSCRLLALCILCVGSLTWLLYLRRPDSLRTPENWVASVLIWGPFLLAATGLWAAYPTRWAVWVSRLAAAPVALFGSWITVAAIIEATDLVTGRFLPGMSAAFGVLMVWPIVVVASFAGLIVGFVCPLEAG